jgi:hypothetical protein
MSICCKTVSLANRLDKCVAARPGGQTEFGTGLECFSRTDSASSATILADALGSTIGLTDNERRRR